MLSGINNPHQQLLGRREVLQKMKSKWYLYTKKADFKAIGERFGIDQVTARILRNRDVYEDRDLEFFLNGSLDDLYDESLLPDIDRACELIISAIKDGKHIRIVGDYDIDGVCSSCILQQGLEELGAKASVRIPDRIKDGYGINRRLVEEAVNDGAGLILTCDNGIAAVSELRYAKEAGLKVVVTDHHSIRTDESGAEILPPADALVDVKLTGSRYPTQEICGAVTAWKLIKRLYSLQGMPDKAWLKFIDLAAIATIGDIMPLTGENRIIVREGLKLINGGLRPDESGESGSCNLGLRTLITALELDESNIGSYHIGFVIGPCINAGGRLESASTALRLFTTTDAKEAELLAGHLRELNEERKSMTEAGVREGMRLVEEQYSDDNVLVVMIPGLHESLAGIVAGRIKEAYYKPTIVITKAKEGLKGSGRSIESYDMFEGLCKASEYMTKFGGHKLAAGMSLEEDKLDAFRARLNADALLTEEELTPKVWIDAAMPIGYISEKIIKELEALAPFGKDFEKPLFAVRDVHITDLRVLGRMKNVLKLRLNDAHGTYIDGIMFGDAGQMYDELREARSISILYYPQINEYAGRKSMQLEIKDYRITG